MISQINVVLVRTLFSGNLGSAARALANMGGDRLILVDPQCQIDDAAKAKAAGAKEWLAATTIYASWDNFFANEAEGIRIGLTRRSGKRRQPKTLQATVKEFKSQARARQPVQPLYLFFGPEKAGLTAEDLAWMHRCASLPTPGEFKSLNLSHAVLLALHLTKAALEVKKSANAEAPLKTKGAAKEAHYFPDKTIRRWLIAMGFSLDRRKASAYLTLRRLLLQNWPTQKELQVLEAILQQNIRKLEMYEASRKATASANFSS